MKEQYIPAPLRSAVKGGNVTFADEILDEQKGKRQNIINQETDNEISGIKGGSTKSIADLSEDIANEAERASGVEAGLRESIDELGQIGLDPDNAISTDGDDFDGDTTAKRSKIPTIGAIIDGNPGVYDVSKRNPTDGPNNDGKFTLEYILENADTLIPTSRRHGGMEICFVHSSDNNYVEYFCNSQTFTTDTTYWEKINLEDEINQIDQILHGEDSSFIHTYIGEYSSDGTVTASNIRAYRLIEIKNIASFKVPSDCWYCLFANNTGENEQHIPYASDYIVPSWTAGGTDYDLTQLGYKYAIVKISKGSTRQDQLVDILDEILEVTYKESGVVEAVNVLGNEVDTLNEVLDASDINKGVKIGYPEPFSSLNLPTIYRNGKSYNVDFDFSQYIYNAELYVDRDNGSDSNTGGKTAPFKTIKKALMSLYTDTTIYVKSSHPFMRDEHFYSDLSLQHNVSLINANEDKKMIVLTTAQTNLSWTQVDNVWSTTRSNTICVFFKNSIDTLFGWKGIPKVADLSTCKNTPNTYFVDGNTVYVNTYNGNAPTDENYLIVLYVNDNKVLLPNNTKIYFEGFGWINGKNINAVEFRPTLNNSGNSLVSHVCLRNCAAGNNSGDDDGGTQPGNGFAFNAIKEILLFNCYAKNSRRDGFNYHYDITSDSLANQYIFEYNCKAVNCGVNDNTQNNNGSTIHDGSKIVRAGLFVGKAKGPAIADTGDCITMCVGCEVDNRYNYSDSMNFPCDNGGKVYLIDCKINKRLVSQGTVYVDNFLGEIEESVDAVEI